MSFFRKNPVVIEAFLWTGGPDQTEDPEWIVDAIKRKDVWFETDKDNPFFNPGEVRMCIKTLEGNHQACVGDYIIKGVKGKLYPCKPDIFQQTYEEVAAPENQGSPANVKTTAAAQNAAGIMRIKIGHLVTDSAYPGRMFWVVGLLRIGELKEVGGLFELADIRTEERLKSIGDNITVWGVISTPPQKQKSACLHPATGKDKTVLA